jgi:hypothetical protein
MSGGNDLNSKSGKLIILLILTFVSGCFGFGKNQEYQPFDAGKLEKLVKGQTTATEVGALFGAPSQVVKMSNGNAYIYTHSVAKGTAVWLLLVSLGNYEKQYDQIIFFFDNNDIMTHYGASFDARDSSYGYPF